MIPGPTALESSTLTTRLPSEGEEGKGSNEKGRGRKGEGDKGKVKRRESEEEKEREGREVSVSVRLSMSSVRLSVCPIHCYAVCARTGTSASCSSGVCVFFILIRQVAAPVLTAYPFTQLIELIKKLLELFCSQSNSFLLRCDEIDFILFLFFCFFYF